MEGAFRDLAVQGGLDVNRLGGVYCQGKEHSFTKKLEVAAAIAVAHVNSRIKEHQMNEECMENESETNDE